MKSAIIVSVILAISGIAAGAEENPCYGVENGIFMPNPPSCRAYFTCKDNVAHPGSCSIDHYFNFDKQICDWPQNVDCVNPTTTQKPDSSTNEQTTTEEATEAASSEQTTSTEEATEPPTTTNTVTEAAPSVCYGLDNGVLVDGGSDDCESFNHCVDNLAYPNTCPEGLLFNGAYCDLETRVDCERGITTSPHTEPAFTTELATEESTIEATEGATELPPPSRCGPNEVGLHSHSSKCSKYIFCMNGIETELSCNPGEHFSEEKRVCVPREHANCRLEHPFCDPTESENSLIFFPHPHDCSQFFICFHGELVQLNCDSGNHWDPVNSWCTSESESSCSK